jgi:hypothetical protein
LGRRYRISNSLIRNQFTPATSSGGFFSKVSPDDMSKGILSISDGIITAANKFNSTAIF